MLKRLQLLFRKEIHCKMKRACQILIKNLKEDLLRKQRLSEQNAMAQENQANGNNVARFTGKQLAENPALLERLF